MVQSSQSTVPYVALARVNWNGESPRLDAKRFGTFGALYWEMQHHYVPPYRLARTYTYIGVDTPLVQSFGWLFFFTKNANPSTAIHCFCTTKPRRNRPLNDILSTTAYRLMLGLCKKDCVLCCLSDTKSTEEVKITPC
jgi:hypothetical protein